MSRVAGRCGNPSDAKTLPVTETRTIFTERKTNLLPWQDKWLDGRLRGSAATGNIGALHTTGITPAAAVQRSFNTSRIASMTMPGSAAISERIETISERIAFTLLSSAQSRVSSSSIFCPEAIACRRKRAESSLSSVRICTMPVISRVETRRVRAEGRRCGPLC